jgi:2-C-methyl-D-erythritol 4-phosphate cytidylyltransferase
MFVAVHDGARPLVTHQMIEECFERVREFGAVAAARRITETIKVASPDGFTRRSFDRTDLWITETPQLFRTRILRRAYEEVAAQRATVTDEVSAVELIGISTFLIQSRTPNPKITHPWDLSIAESMLG